MSNEDVAKLLEAVHCAATAGQAASKDENEGELREAVNELRSLATRLLLAVTRW